ncbi:MAG TPA: hypothetical protein VFR62_00715 [Gemmatimonadales bacterium]|nr:hypothetical protein [Gemmatimonadales bacterium]
MRTRSKLALIFAWSAIAVAAFAAPGLADPPDSLISPPNHRHFIVSPDGDLVPVGPQICLDPGLQQAFNAFHYNVHHSEVPGIGDVLTLGPQDGAPGLHNGHGAEVIGVRGC